MHYYSYKENKNPKAGVLLVHVKKESILLCFFASGIGIAIPQCHWNIPVFHSRGIDIFLKANCFLSNDIPSDAPPGKLPAVNPFWEYIASSEGCSPFQSRRLARSCSSIRFLRDNSLDIIDWEGRKGRANLCLAQLARGCCERGWPWAFRSSNSLCIKSFCLWVRVQLSMVSYVDARTKGETIKDLCLSLSP